MCNCNNIEFGTYDASTLITNPFTDKAIEVDKCILAEIKDLWIRGIETIESCCGHNKTKGYIAVVKKDIGRMVSIGYQYDTTTITAGVFYPKGLEFIPQKKVNRGKPIHELNKIPDQALIKMYRTEIGKQKSYIQELEDKIKSLENHIESTKK